MGTLCRERKLRVAKRRVGRYPKEFRRMVVERLKSCDNIVALAQELGLHRRLLYKWRDQLEPVEHGEPVPSTPELRQQVRQLKRLLAEKTMEVDFFKGALQKVEARRQRSSSSGERTSTTKSGK
jgi:transposase-like protein